MLPQVLRGGPRRSLTSTQASASAALTVVDMTALKVQTDLAIRATEVGKCESLLEAGLVEYIERLRLVVRTR